MRDFFLELIDRLSENRKAILIGLCIVGFILLLAVSLKASSETLTAKFTNGLTITLNDGPCDKKVLRFIKPEYQSKAHGGVAVFPDATYLLCWTLSPSNPGMIIFVDETGDGGELLVEVFQRSND